MRFSTRTVVKWFENLEFVRFSPQNACGVTWSISQPETLKTECSEDNTETEYQYGLAPAKLHLIAENSKRYKMIEHTHADYECG
jgi:hypothetical protein